MSYINFDKQYNTEDFENRPLEEDVHNFTEDDMLFKIAQYKYFALKYKHQEKKTCTLCQHFIGNICRHPLVGVKEDIGGCGKHFLPIII